MRTQAAAQKSPRGVSRNSARLGFHEGQAFCRVASDYPSLHDVILEQVQNALDANATRISIVLNKKTRHIAIRDNGDGVSEEGFNLALQQVCQTQKERSKLGRFGIGLISPLDKCEMFRFVSIAKGAQANDFREWTFVTKDIKAQASDVQIPKRSRKDLFYVTAKDKAKKKTRRGVTYVPWRTEVNILKYSKDTMISRIVSVDNLIESILDRFGPTMRKHSVELDVTFVESNGKREVHEGVRAKLFTGRALPIVKIADKSVGEVEFEMFIATKTTAGRNGKVVVGESDNDFRLPFSNISRQAASLLPDDVRSAMSLGLFEGQITGKKLELRSTRKSFERDDAFLGFITAIDTWYRKHGEAHVKEAQEETKDERYQAVGLESLSVIEQMLKKPEFGDLQSVLSSFQLGSVGDGHAPHAKSRIAGTQDEKSVRTQAAADGSKVNGRSRAGNPEKDRQEHQPYTVAGPRGKRRRLVRRDSLGLQLSVTAMDGSDRLWELDMREGVLHFNASHPTFVEFDRSDRKLRQLFETVTVQALTVAAMPEEVSFAVRMAFDEQLKSLAHLYNKSSAFAFGRRKVS